MPGFNISSGKGFHIVFKNGTTVSVQFGSGNYCHNRDLPYERERQTPFRFECPDAEIAIFLETTDKWLTRKYDKSLSDDVKGYCGPEEIAKAIAWAAKYDKKLNQIGEK